MKTILIYAQRGSAGYNGFFLSLLREGRIRRWRFAIVEPTSAPDEAERVGVHRLHGRRHAWRTCGR